MQNPIVQQIVETLRGANNVLITVKNSPSVDELTASIALTLILNHMNKHATTVFSGQVPSTIEFLQPEMAIETTTDSLRDFIIALDKSKADKLRYKVENDVVRIFITPYRSSISEEDLEFSQGDFNVDVVVALGVLNKDDFDQAVLEHGRILHDATVIAINNQPVPNEVGALSWQDQQASSVSEMIAGIADLFGQNILDGQIATALMTGIVAETDRFKNQKTTPAVLSISSTLMSAGANQQLIAEELERPAVVASSVQPLQFGLSQPPTSTTDGTLSVPHDVSTPMQEIAIDEHGNINTFGQPQQQDSPPLQDIQHDLGLEATSHTENDDIDQSVLEQPAANENEFEQPVEQDQAHSLIEDRSFLAPPMNANSENESAQEEPTGLFGSFMHRVKSTSHKPEVVDERQGIAPSRQKRIEPLESYQDGLDFQDDLPLFKAEESALPLANDDHAPIQETDDKQSPFTELDDHQAELPVSPAPYMPPVMPSQPAPSAAITSDPFLSESPLVGDDQGDQTLEDIERAVHSHHVETGAAIETVGSQFMGGAKPAGLEEFAAELPPVVNSVPPVIDGASESPAVSPYSPPVAASIPPTDTATAPPIVPPPLMPQAGGSQMPQFFEADGTKSNPFVSAN